MFQASVSTSECCLGLRLYQQKLNFISLCFKIKSFHINISYKLEPYAGFLALFS